MEQYLHDYDQFTMADPNKSYEWLRDMAKKKISQEMTNRNQQLILKHAKDSLNRNHRAAPATADVKAAEKAAKAAAKAAEQAVAAAHKAAAVQSKSGDSRKKSRTPGGSKRSNSQGSQQKRGRSGSAGSKGSQKGKSGKKKQSSQSPARSKTPGGKGSCPAGSCYPFWKYGNCTRGDCKYTHTTNPNKAAPARSPSPGGKPLCTFWAKRLCTRGNDCPYSHNGRGGPKPDSQAAAPVSAGNTPRSGKGAKKKNKKSPAMPAVQKPSEETGTAEAAPASSSSR